jgi:hypothetical protein
MEPQRTSDDLARPLKRLAPTVMDVERELLVSGIDGASNPESSHPPQTVWDQQRRLIARVADATVHLL